MAVDRIQQRSASRLERPFAVDAVAVDRIEASATAISVAN
jgi:hypothetical protein